MLSGVKFNSKTFLFSSLWPKMPLKASKLKFLKISKFRSVINVDYCNLRHLEAFFGHVDENKKVLELNFTPDNTP